MEKVEKDKKKVEEKKEPEKKNFIPPEVESMTITVQNALASNVIPINNDPNQC